MIEKVLREALEALRQPKPPNELGVSELAGCGYKAVLNRQQRIVTEAMLRGVAIHEGALRKLANTLVEHGFVVVKEHHVELTCGDKKVSGYIDLFVESPERVVIELKSTIRIENNPFETWYVRQVAMYSYMTGADYGYLVFVKADTYDYTIKRINEKLNPCTRIEYWGVKEFGPWCVACQFRKICLN